MKKNILILATLFVFAITNAVYANGGNTEEEEELRNIDLIILQESGLTVFSLFQPTAYATLCNKVVSVDLSELPEGATVTITRTATVEEVYSQTGMGSMEIDLSACGKGQYQIDVVSGGLWLQGYFSL